MAVRRGSWDDFDTVAQLAAPGAKPEEVRSRWELPSFDPGRHVWLADGAFGALYAPDEAVVRGNAAAIPTLLAAIERQAHAEGLAQLTFVLPECDEPAWRAYLDYGFELATEVLQMEADLAQAPPRATFPVGVDVRTYAPRDARAVQALLDEAYLAWDDTYVPMQHDDWAAWMTTDTECWWLAEAEGELSSVCLTWAGGWVKDIATAQAWRGRGIGKALLLHALAEHRARDNAKVGLKVDARNPTGAVQLYERCGFRVERRFLALVKRL